MSKLYELLKNEKAEWMKLEDLLDYEQPGKYIVKSTNYSNNFEIPVLTAGQTFVLGYTDEKDGIYEASRQKPVIIFDDFTAGSHWVDFNFKVKSSAMKFLKPKNNSINLRYCYHYIKTIKFDVSEHKRVWISQFSQIKIPVPSLETQETIVKILDKFTNYVTELQTRNIQYMYYRDKLLSEEYLNKISEDIFVQQNSCLETAALINIAELTRGKRLVRSELYKEGQYPVFQNSLTPLGYYDRKNFDGDKVCVISAGAAGDVFYMDTAFWAADDVFVISASNNIVSNKYLYYFLLNKQAFIKSKVRKASIPRLSRDELSKISILIPTIEIQNKVVEILDRFQALLADTKGLLPQEIEERQKQYEYYRKKLLTFKLECDSKQASKHNP